MEILARERERISIFIPLKIAKRKCYKNAEPYSRRFKSRKIRSSAERMVPPCSTHIQPGNVSSFLILQGERSSWYSCRASPSTTEEEKELEEGGAAPKARVLQPSHPLYL